MSRFSEEHIFNYLDQALSNKEVEEFERELQKDPELKHTVAQLRIAHLSFSENHLEQAPQQLTNKVLKKVVEISKEDYYQPAGLFSNSSFLLISGILTAMVAFLSLLNGGYISLPSFPDIGFLTDTNILENFANKRLITNSMLAIFGILALALFDRLVLNPYFRKKNKRLGF